MFAAFTKRRRAATGEALGNFVDASAELDGVGFEPPKGAGVASNQPPNSAAEPDRGACHGARSLNNIGGAPRRVSGSRYAQRE